MLKDLVDLQFPDTMNNREQYFVTVSRNRCVWAFALGFLLALLF